MGDDMSVKARLARYLEDFGRGVFALAEILLSVLFGWGLPLAVVFVVVFLAVKAAS